jgi:hypothetical protein
LEREKCKRIWSRVIETWGHKFWYTFDNAKNIVEMKIPLQQIAVYKEWKVLKRLAKSLKHRILWIQSSFLAFGRMFN